MNNQKQKKINNKKDKVSYVISNTKKIVILSLMFLMSIMIVVNTYATVNTISYSYLDVNLINQDPDPANPGGYVELRFKVEKLGNAEFDDVEFYLEAEYPFSFDASDEPLKKVGGWKGYSTGDNYYTLYYKLRVDENAIEDDYKLNLKTRYTSAGKWNNNQFIVRVGDSNDPNLQVGLIETQPLRLTADIDESELSVELMNIGKGDAENVIVDIVLPQGFTATYGYSYRSKLGTIENGDSKVAKFYIDTEEDLEAGVYSTELIVKYIEEDDEDNEYTEKVIPFDIIVLDKPSFKILEYKIEPQNPMPGDDVVLQAVILNSGKDSDSVSFRVLKDSSQPFNFDEKSDYVGTLDKDQRGDALLRFTIDDDANVKEYIMDVEMRGVYDNEVYVNSDTIKINLANKGFSMKNLLTAIVVILGIVGLIFYFYTKNKK